MNKYKIKVDAYGDIQYVGGFADHVECLIYIPGIVGDSVERVVNLEDFSKFIEEDDIEDYWNNESLQQKTADLETYINSKENRIYEYRQTQIA